jgi:hypothetical protein
MISNPKSFIFVHINCCAGTSIEAAFEPWGEWRPENPTGRLFNRTQHANVQEYLNAGFVPNKYFMFAIVRNPWDRMATYYATHRRYHKFSFTDWVNQLGPNDGEKTLYDFPRMYSSCASWLENNESLDIDFIGRYETLQDDFTTICEKIGVATSLPHLNNSKKPFYVEYYDEESRQVIERRFKKDIDLFGYSFGE